VIGLVFRRIVLALTAAAMLAAAGGVVVVALAFALYALVKPYVGPAGASGIVAGAASLFIGLGAAILYLSTRQKPSKELPPTARGLADRAMNFLREKPVMTISAAIGAGFLAVRNPRYLGAAARSFLEGREPPPRRRR
jgi:hypothetical protein